MKKNLLTLLIASSALLLCSCEGLFSNKSNTITTNESKPTIATSQTEPLTDSSPVTTTNNASRIASQTTETQTSTNIVTNDKVTVYFDTQGGTIVESYEIEKASKISKPESPAKTGYEFVDWYTDSNFNYKFNFESKIYEDTTLYAKWNEIKHLEFELDAINDTYIVKGIGNIDSANIIIPEKYNSKYVTELADNAFSANTKIETIEMPNSIKVIGNECFKGCIKLSSIKMSSEIEKIGRWAFDECNKLKFNKYENVYYLGDNDNSYKYLIKPENTSISELEINECCEVISSCAFYDCNQLYLVEIPSTVKELNDGVFCNTSLKKIVLPTSINKIEALSFMPTTDLMVYYKGTEENWNKIEIAEYSFSETARLWFYNKDMPAKNEPYWHYENGFPTIYDYEYRYELSTNKNYYTIKGWITTGIGSHEGETLEIPSYYNGLPVRAIGKVAFSLSKIKKLIIPDTVLNIEDYAFSTCTDLYNVELSNNIILIGKGAFFKCYSLASIVLPETLELIDDSAFLGCDNLIEIYNLSNIDITKGSSENGWIGYSLDIIHKNLNEKSVVNIVNDYIIHFTTNTSSEKIARLMRYIGNETELQIPSSFKYDNENYELRYISNYSFYSNEKLTKITFPNTIGIIAKYAFYGCTNLSTVLMPNINFLMKECFSNCESLNVFIIPSTIMWIDESIFKGTPMKIALYMGDITQWNKLIVNETNAELNEALYIYSESAPTDKTHNYWHYDSSGNAAFWE